jgi:hypothetical protein
MTAPRKPLRKIEASRSAVTNARRQSDGLPASRTRQRTNALFNGDKRRPYERAEPRGRVSL